MTSRLCLPLSAVLLAVPLAAQVEFAGRFARVSVVDSVAPARADGSAEPSAEAPVPWGRWSAATGGWGGLRPRLVAAGVSLEAAYIYDLSGNARGGVRRSGVGRGLLSAGLGADLEALAGLRGAALFVGVQSYGGTSGATLTGDAQAFSNIDASRFVRLAEAWYEQRLAGDGVRVKLGQVDANSEFAVVEPAGEFLNASAGFSPTIYALPTYPEPTPSASLFLAPAGWLQLSGGVFRGTLTRGTGPAAPGHAPFAIGEVAGSWGSGRVLLGYWQHPGGYAEQFNGGFTRSPAGWYAGAEQRVTGAPEGEASGAHGAVVFAKYGRSPDRFSPFGQHLMLGLVEERPLGLEGHAAGMMVSHVDLSDAAGAGTPANETSVEAFYRLPTLGFLTLRPDLQYIVHPAGDRALGDALVGTLRAELVF